MEGHSGWKDAAAVRHQDGGWYGWMVVFASHFCNIFVLGLQQAIGPLFVALQQDFHATSANTSWLLSLMFLFQFGCGPIANVGVKRFGHRATVMIGSVVSSAGLLLSSFARTMETVNITFGVLVGFGYALIYSPSIGIVAAYIKRKYVLANSLVMVGSGVGGIALPPLFQFLINKYGWRETLLVFSGMNLQMCICALFFRRPETSARSSVETTERSRQVSNSRREGSFFGACAERLDLYVFVQYKQFTVYVITVFLGIGLGLFGALPHFYVRAEDLDLAPSQRLSFLLSIFGVFGTIGRLVPNLMRRGSSVYSFGFSIFLAGVLNLVSAFTETYVSYAVYVALLGFCIGIISSLQIQVVRDMVGPQTVTAAIGLATPFLAVGGLFGPTLAGFIYDKTGDYDFSFYFYGACSVAAGLLLVAADPFVKPGPDQRRQSLLDLESGPVEQVLLGGKQHGTRRSYGTSNQRDTEIVE